MNRFIKYSCCIALIALSFSCASRKETVYQNHIPATQKKPPIQDSDQGSSSIKLSEQKKMIARHAVKSLGLPYKWGGNSPETGFDCSCLTSYTHKKAGIIIPRTAKAQFNKGQFVEKQNLQTGDLVFFNAPQKKGGWHVGIYIGKGHIIHAPGNGSKVTYGDLNHPYFKKYYMGTRRYY